MQKWCANYPDMGTVVSLNETLKKKEKGEERNVKKNTLANEGH